METVAALTMAPIVVTTAVRLVDGTHCLGRHDDSGICRGIGADVLARIYDGGLGYGHRAVDWTTGCDSGRGAKSLTQCSASQTNSQAGVLSAWPSMGSADGM